MPEIHAKLSASSSHRWLHCPPSVKLEEDFPESTSEYAQEGTLAHSICELKLSKQYAPMGPRTFTTRFNKLKKDAFYQDEMDKYTDDYIEFIKGQTIAFNIKPTVLIEKQVSFGNYVPEGFGTSDCIIIGGDIIEVVDFKYGKGVEVSAEENTQMMLYALGALDTYGMLYDIKTVKMSIIQPRINNYSTWTVGTQYLRDWGESIKPTAQMAFNGEGEFSSGEWCRFCKAKATCRARAEKNLELAKLDFAKGETLTNDEIGDILVKAQDLAQWAADLKDYALQECLNGGDITGWKAVEGRSVRQFKNTEDAFKVVTDSGIDEAMLYERKPITLTAVEKLLGKKAFDELLADEVIKPQGKPTLVPITDKRPVYSTIEKDFK